MLDYDYHYLSSKYLGYKYLCWTRDLMYERDLIYKDYLEIIMLSTWLHEKQVEKKTFVENRTKNRLFSCLVV